MGIFAFLTWDVLATFSGAVGLTVIIVQMLKWPLDHVWKIPTRYLVYIVCLGIMLLAQVFLGTSMSLQTIAITAVNAVLGSLTAMSLYEQIIKLPEEKRLTGSFQYMMTGELAETEGTDTAEKEQQADAVKTTANGQNEPPST